jgi:hypothetical protein
MCSVITKVYNKVPLACSRDSREHIMPVHKLGAKLGMDPTALLRMINGKAPLTKVVLVGLAKELGSDIRYLEKLATEIKP